MNSPRIDYAWDFQSAAESGRNYNRLERMTYPKRLASATRREIHFGYGNSTSSTDIDDALSRITEISDPASNAWAKYNYAGMSRRAGMLLGCGVLARFTSGSANSLPGLDRFGRIADLHYRRKFGERWNPILVREENSCTATVVLKLKL